MRATRWSRTVSSLISRSRRRSGRATAAKRGRAAGICGLLPWSSIDNDESRDLDQLEVCVEERRRRRLLIAIADVDVLVPKDSPLDDHARAQHHLGLYAGEHLSDAARELSTDRTSLNQDAGSVRDRHRHDGRRRRRRRHRRRSTGRWSAIRRKLTYNGLAAWFEGSGPAPHAFAEVSGPRSADPAAGRDRRQLRECRETRERSSSRGPSCSRSSKGTRVSDLRTETTNRAQDDDRELHDRRQRRHGAIPARERVCRRFGEWSRAPNAGHASWTSRRSMAGSCRPRPTPRRCRVPEGAARGGAGHVPGSVARRSSSCSGAASTSRRRRSSRRGTSRSRRELHALDGAEPPLSRPRHAAAAQGGDRAFAGAVRAAGARRLAEHCTKQEDAANKVERLTRKAAAALWLTPRIGETFDSIVTGAGRKAPGCGWCRRRWKAGSSAARRDWTSAIACGCGWSARTRDAGSSTSFARKFLLVLADGFVRETVAARVLYPPGIQVHVRQLQLSAAEIAQRVAEPRARARQAVEKQLLRFRRRDLERRAA